MKTAHFAAILTGLGLVTAPGASAQQTIQACTSQQELEQVITSQGQITPDGCRAVSISVLESTAGRLCLVDFSSDGDGIVEQLRDVATNEQWWVRCDDLTSAPR